MRYSRSAALVAVGATVLACLTTSCGSDSAASVPTGADLKGTWVGSATGYQAGKPVTWKDEKMVIAEADGQGFGGFVTYTDTDGTPKKETVSGVISPDGNILIAEDVGHFQLRLVGGKMQGQFVETGDPAGATAVNVEYSRQ